jgi:hypothetical protein
MAGFISAIGWKGEPFTYETLTYDGKVELY